MSSMGISLTPPSTDVSTGLISSLIGPGWWGLATGAAPTGAGTVLAHLFSIFDIALLLYVSALLVYQATVGSMATAHEGTPLGRRYHSIWAPIRGPASFALLFPLPWAKGLALIQCIALLAVYWGIGVADDVWSGFVQDIPKMDGTLMPNQQSIDRDNRLVAKALLMATAQEYLIQRDHLPLSSHWVWRGGINSGSWILTQQLGNSASGNAVSGIPTKKFIAGLGAIDISCSNHMQKSTGANEGLFGGGVLSDIGYAVTSSFNWVANIYSKTALPGSFDIGLLVHPAQNNPVCLAERNAVSSAMNAIYPIATQIVNQNAQTNANPVLPSQIAQAVDIYRKQQETAYNEMNNDRQAALKAQTQAFANESSKLGWASSSFYYWTLNNINAESQAYLKMLRPKIILPNMGYVSQVSGNYIDPSMMAALSVINHYESSDSYVGGAEAVATTGTSKGGLFSSGSGEGWPADKIAGLVSGLESGNPLANMMSAGHEIINVGYTVVAGPTILETALKTAGSAIGFAAGAAIPGADVGPGEATGTIIGRLGGSWVAGALAGAAGRAMSAMRDAGKLALPVGLFMVVEGAIIAYVIPSIPGVIMIFAIIGWVFMVLELMVAAPLWAAAHAYAEGEGFAPNEAMYGYSAAVGVVMRPALLTFGFILMFYMIFIIGHFVGTAMEIYMTGMNGFHVGIVGSVAILAIIIGTIFGSIKIVMKLITHLADSAPQYLGARVGNNMNFGEEGVKAASGGAEKAKTVATAGYALASRNLRKRPSAADLEGGEDGGQDGKGQGGKGSTKKSTTNPGTTPENLSAGDTSGKQAGGKGSAGEGIKEAEDVPVGQSSGKTETSGGETGGKSRTSGGETDRKSETSSGKTGGKSGDNSGGSGKTPSGGGSSPKSSFGKGFERGRRFRNWLTGRGTQGKK